MNSPELLLLVENCPKGAETLVTRCLHILTDKGKTTTWPLFCAGAQLSQKSSTTELKCVKNSPVVRSVPPSPELVERVRDLYHKRVPDVRFLIPVINGLEKVA